MIASITTTSTTSDPTGDYALSPNVVLVQVDDGTARLLDLTGHFHALSPIAARMLSLTLERGSATTIDQIARDCAAPRERVATDLNGLLGQLKRDGLIRPSKSRSWRFDWTLGLGTLAVMALLLSVRLCPFGLRIRTSLLLTAAYLSFRFAGWQRTLAAWGRAKVSTAPGEVTDVIEQIDEAVRRGGAGHLLPVACKERAICCWWLLRRAGVPATLVVGLNLCPLGGHCWCEVGNQCLSDDPERCEQFSPVIRYT